MMHEVLKLILLPVSRDRRRHKDYFSIFTIKTQHAGVKFNTAAWKGYQLIVLERVLDSRNFIGGFSFRILHNIDSSSTNLAYITA